MAPVTDAPEDPSKKKTTDPAADATDDPNATTTEDDQTSETLHSDADGADPANQEAFTLSLNAQQFGALPFVTDFDLTGTALPTDLANKNIGTLNAADLSLAVNPLPASLAGKPDLLPGAIVSPELSAAQIAAAGGDATLLASLTANQASYAARQTELNARHAKGDYSDLDAMFATDTEVAKEYRTNPEYAQVMKEYEAYTQRKQAGDYGYVNTMTEEQYQQWKSTASPQDLAAYANYESNIANGNYNFVDKLSPENRAQWMATSSTPDFEAYWNFEERKQAGDYSFVNNMSNDDLMNFIETSSDAEWNAYRKYLDNTAAGNFDYVDKMTPEAKADWMMNSSDAEFQGYQNYKDKIANGDYSFVNKLPPDAKTDWLVNSSTDDFIKYVNYQNKIDAGDYSFLDKESQANQDDFLLNASDADWNAYVNYKDKINAGDYSFTEKLNDANYTNFITNSTDEEFNSYLNYTERKAAGDYSYVDRLNPANRSDFIVNSSDEDFNKYMDYKNRQAAGDFSYVDRLSNEAQSDWFATASPEDLNGYFGYRDKVAANDYSFLNGLNSNNLADWQKNATPEQLQAAIDYAQTQAVPGDTTSGATVPVTDTAVVQPAPIQTFDSTGQPIPASYDTTSGRQIAPLDAEGKPVQTFDKDGKPIQSFEQAVQPNPIPTYDASGQVVPPRFDATSGKQIPPLDTAGQPIQTYDKEGKPIQSFEQAKPVAPVETVLPATTIPAADSHAPKVVKGPDGKLMLVTADSPGVPVPATAAENRQGMPTTGDLQANPPLTPAQIEAKRLAGTTDVAGGATTPLTEAAKKDIAANLEKFKDDPVARAQYLAQVSNMGPQYRAEVQGEIAKLDAAGKQSYGQALTELIRAGQPAATEQGGVRPPATDVKNLPAGSDPAVLAANDQRAKLEQARATILGHVSSGDGSTQSEVVDKFGKIRDGAPVVPPTGDHTQTKPGTGPTETGPVSPQDLAARTAARTEALNPLVQKGLVDQSDLTLARQLGTTVPPKEGTTVPVPGAPAAPVDLSARRDQREQQIAPLETHVVPKPADPALSAATIEAQLKTFGNDTNAQAKYLASLSTSADGIAAVKPYVDKLQGSALDTYKDTTRAMEAAQLLSNTPRVEALTPAALQEKLKTMTPEQQGAYIAQLATSGDKSQQSLVSSVIPTLSGGAKSEYEKALKADINTRLTGLPDDKARVDYLNSITAIAPDVNKGIVSSVATDKGGKVLDLYQASQANGGAPTPVKFDPVVSESRIQAIKDNPNLTAAEKAQGVTQVVTNAAANAAVTGDHGAQQFADKYIKLNPDIASGVQAGLSKAITDYKDTVGAATIVPEKPAKGDTGNNGVGAGTDSSAKPPTSAEIQTKLDTYKTPEEKAKYLSTLPPETVNTYFKETKGADDGAIRNAYTKLVENPGGIVTAPAGDTRTRDGAEKLRVEAPKVVDAVAGGTPGTPGKEVKVDQKGTGGTDQPVVVAKPDKGPPTADALIADAKARDAVVKESQTRIEGLQREIMAREQMLQLTKGSDAEKAKLQAALADVNGAAQGVKGDGKGGPDGRGAADGGAAGGKPLTIDQMREEIAKHVLSASSPAEQAKWEQAGRRLDFLEKTAGGVVTDSSGNRFAASVLAAGGMHLDEKGVLVNAGGKPVFSGLNRDGMIDSMGTVFTKVGGTGLPMAPGTGRGEVGVSLTGKDGVIIGKDGVVIGGKDAGVVGIGRDGAVLRMDPTTGRPMLDPVTGKPIFDFPGGKHDGMVLRGEMSGIAGPLPPGARLEIGGRDGFVRIDPATGKPIDGIRLDANGKPIEGLRIDPITGRAELVGGKGELGGIGRQAIDPTTGLPIKGSIGLDGIPIGKFDAKGMPITADGKAVALPPGSTIGPGGVIVPGPLGKGGIAADGTGAVLKDAQGNVINPTTGQSLINIPGFGQQPTGANLPGAGGKDPGNVPGAGGAGGAVQMQPINLPGVQITGAGGTVVSGQQNSKDPGQQGGQTQAPGTSVSVNNGTGTGQVAGPGSGVVTATSGTVVVGMTVTTGKDSISAGGGLSVSGVGLNSAGGINIAGGATVTGGVSLTGATALGDKTGLPGTGATIPGGKELAPGTNTATATAQAVTDPNAAQTNFAPPAAQNPSGDRKIVLDGSGKSATTADGTVVTVDANRQITSSNATVYIDNRKGFAITDGGGVIFVDKNGNLKVLLDELPADSQQATGNSKAISWQDSTGQQYTTANSHVVSIDNGTVTKYGDEPHVIVLSPDGRPVSSGDTTTIILNGTRPTGVGDDVVVVIDRNPNVGSGNIVYVSPDGKPLESSSGTLVWVDQTGQTQGSNVHVFFTDPNGHPIAQDSSSTPTGTTVVIGGQLVTHNPQDVDNIPPDVLSQMLKDIGITTSSGTAIPTNNTSTDTSTQIGTGTQTGTQTQTGTEIKTGDTTQTGPTTGTTTPPDTEIKTGDTTQTGTTTGTTTPPGTEIKTGDTTQTGTTTGTNTTTTNPDGNPIVPISGEIVVKIEPTPTPTPTPTPKSDVEVTPKPEPTSTPVTKPDVEVTPKPEVKPEPKPEPLPVPKGNDVTPTVSHEPDIVVHVQVGDSSSHSTSQPVSHSDGGYSSQEPIVHETSSGTVVYSNQEPVSHQTQPGYSVVDAVVDIAIGSQSGQPVQAHSEPVANQDVVTAQPKAHTDVEYSAGLGDISKAASTAPVPAYFDPMPAASSASFPLDDISHSSENFPHQVAEVTHKIDSETVEHSFIEAPAPRPIEDFAVSRPNDVAVKETTDNSASISQQTPANDLTPPFAPMLEPTVPPVTLPQAEQAGYSVADRLVANTNPPVSDPQPVMSDIDTPVAVQPIQSAAEPVNPFVDGMNQAIAPALDVAPIASHHDHDRDDDGAQPAISLPTLPVDVTTIGSAPLVELADPTVPGGLNTEAIIHDMEDRAEVGRLMGTSYDWKVEEINKYDEIEKERRERYELELAENRRRDQELREDREQRELEERAKRFSDAMLAAMATKKTRNPVEGLEENFVPEVRQKYVVLQGDTLESIAIKKLRDKRLAPLLYEINKHLIPSRMQGDIRYLQLSPRSVIQLPTQAEIRRFHARLFGRQSIKFQYEEAPEGMCNSSRATNPGLIRLGLLPAAAAAGQPKSEAEVEKDATRRANVESLLGSVAKTQAPPADGRIRYICRLGDTLRSVAMRHPALKDVTLWKLLAEVNELTTDVDGKGTPVAQIKRGTTISLPTLEEIESFKLKLKPPKTAGKAEQITAPQAPYSVPAESDPSMATTLQDVQIKIGDESQDVTQDPVVGGSGTVIVSDNTSDSATRVAASNVLPFVRPGDIVRYTPPGIATRDPDDATNSLLQAAGMVPREGQQLQKAVGDDRGQRNIIQHLSETCRIVNYGNTGEGDGAGFRTRLEVRQEDFWRPVVQYEVNADVTLRHEFSVTGKKTTSRIDLPPHAAKELAENDISAHWEKYSCNFQQGRKIAE